jgi:BlaI family penicillinase repressor
MGKERRSPPLPSDAELKVLRELWHAGELTVREVHERVRDDWPVRSTTVLKLLQRMFEKGLVRRREDGRAHRYRAGVEEEQLERRLVRDFLSRTFEGSVQRLIQRALPEDPADPEDLEEIRRILDRMDE